MSPSALPSHWKSDVRSYYIAESECRQRVCVTAQDTSATRLRVTWSTRKSSVALAPDDACSFHAFSWHRMTPVCPSHCVGDSFRSDFVTAWRWHDEQRRSHRRWNTSVYTCQDPVFSYGQLYVGLSHAGSAECWLYKSIRAEELGKSADWWQCLHCRNVVYVEVYGTPTVKGKGKTYLYSAFHETSTQGAQVWITQCCPCKLHHICLYLANVRKMAPPERQTSDSARYSFIDPGRMKGWVGLIDWPIADVIPT